MEDAGQHAMNSFIGDEYSRLVKNRVLVCIREMNAVERDSQSFAFAAIGFHLKRESQEQPKLVKGEDE